MFYDARTYRTSVPNHIHHRIILAGLSITDTKLYTINHANFTLQAT